MTTRRSFLTGLASLVAAPAVITTPGMLMPVKALPKVWKPCTVTLAAMPFGHPHYEWLVNFAGEVLTAYNELPPERVMLEPHTAVFDCRDYTLPPHLRITGPAMLDIESNPMDFRGRIYPRVRAVR